MLAESDKQDNGSWPKNALDCFFLQGGVVIVDSPGIGDSEHISKIVLAYMPQACAFVYVINSPNAGGLQEDRVSTSLFSPIHCER